MRISDKQIWLIVGSQYLYGPEILEKVAANANQMANTLNERPEIPVNFCFKQVVTNQEQIYQVCQEAGQHEDCVGIVTWMHTFSPAKMWTRGLNILNKPLCHLHTQFNQHIPWEEIDMDFMNLNQAAHGDREFGHLLTRMGIGRKVIVGFWQTQEVIKQLALWIRAALGWDAMQGLKVARIGDNMRDVAVTEGDKVEAEIRFGVSVNGYGVGDLVQFIDGIDQNQVDQLLQEYRDLYTIGNTDFSHLSLREAARIELGLRSFLDQGGFKAFTTTFENLHGLHQLPGISVQRLMSDGYGFGAEGDWKTALLLRAIKVMHEGLAGGSSFMEDYTYHYRDTRSAVLGAHMLEICPSIASGKPRCEIHPLSIGGKEDPARLVFESSSGPAINISLVDLGTRFRMVVNQVKVIQPLEDLPRLPVARILWEPEPSLEVSAHAWLLAGGAHHTVFAKAVNVEMIEDLADIAGVELLIIDENTNIRDFKEKLRWNECYYR